MYECRKPHSCPFASRLSILYMVRGWFMSIDSRPLPLIADTYYLMCLLAGHALFSCVLCCGRASMGFLMIFGIVLCFLSCAVGWIMSPHNFYDFGAPRRRNIIATSGWCGDVWVDFRIKQAVKALIGLELQRQWSKQFSGWCISRGLASNRRLG